MRPTDWGTAREIRGRQASVQPPRQHGGVRAWRDFAVDLERSLDYAGDCPIGTLGSQLAETDPDARKEVAAGFALWEKSVVDGLQAIQDRGERAWPRRRSCRRPGVRTAPGGPSMLIAPP